MYESKDKLVSHPDHYQSETGLEVIDVIEAFTFDLQGIEAVDTANILKYVCRWKKKNGVQDLEKAMWYLQHLIDHTRKINMENIEIGDERISIEDYVSNVTCFMTKAEAADVYEKLIAILNKNGKITIRDLSKLADNQNNYVHATTRFGWTNLDSSRVKYIEDDGVAEDYYQLILPTVEFLAD